MSQFERKKLVVDEKGSHGDRSAKICESAWLHVMYHIGAVLINNNQTNGELLDLDILNNVGNLLLFSGKTNKSKAVPLVTKDDLITRYYQVTPLTALNGHHVIQNPLHAVFVIKIALDHCAPEMIHQCYKKILKQSIGQSISSSVVTLSDHSQLMSTNSALDILRAYISSNAELFPMIKTQDIKIMSEVIGPTRSYNFITGFHDQNGYRGLTALQAILPRFDYSKKLEIDNKLNWRFD